MRRFFTAIFGFALRIFFKKIAIVGEEKVPAEGAVMFVLNHPSALIDPGVVLCLAPRPVSFLAKSPLFSMPLVSIIVKAFDSLPVYRRQDQGVDRSKNKETFVKARDLLARGGSIAIFPEGTSHSDPKLRKIKTGAARLALGSASMQDPADPPFKIIPAGLYYTDKQTFRSSMLLYYDAPLTVGRVELDENFEPPWDVVQALTAQIGEALDEVTLQAENAEAIALVKRAERIYSSSLEEEEQARLESAFELKRAFLKGYHALKEEHPERLEAIVRRITRYEERVGALGLDVEHIQPELFTFGAVLTYALRSLAFLTLLGPFAVTGTIVHYPAYYITAVLSTKMAKGEEDMVATIKLLSAMLFFVLTWVGVGVGLAFVVWWPFAIVAALLTPLTGYAALIFQERFDRSLNSTWGLWVFLTRRGEYARLDKERRAIREDILALNALLELSD